jgi:subtilisin family serine protease
VGIWSTYFISDSSYTAFSGTSMATPHVTGAVALLSSLNPSLSVASLKATLLNTVDVLPNWNGLVKTGGRLNVANALQNQTVCGYNLGGNLVTVPTKGGYFSVNVTAPPNCDFTVKSNASWVHISGANVLTGNGTVTFRVSVNPTITRSATVTIAGQNVTVVQSRVPTS